MLPRQIWVTILLFLGSRKSDQTYHKREYFAVITYSTWALSAEVRAEGGRKAEWQLAELRYDIDFGLFENKEVEKGSHSTYSIFGNPARSQNALDLRIT